jgi:predicted DCC family thiol-disulfide oxidoreductase YuxK
MSRPSARPCGYSIVLFDGDCPLCSGEMRRLKVHDRTNRLRLVDIAHPDFDSVAWGFERAALSSRLHVRDESRRWLVGMPAIRHVYATVGAGWVMALTRLPVLAPLADWVYARIAPNRKLISTLLGLEGCGGRAACRTAERDTIDTRGSGK